MVAKNDAIDPDLIELDKENPRILHLMETTQMEDISAELIHLALKGTASGFKQLTTAIKLNKGIINPIIVNKKNGKMVAIDGNTRLLIYQEFKKENPQTEAWQKIPCVIYENLDRAKIDALRLQIHLIGPKAWKPYAKAKYLFSCFEQGFDPEELVDLCGGSKSTVNKLIAAYRDMEKYYRSSLENPDTEFEVEKFSYFIVWQNPKLQSVLKSKDYGVKNYTDWVIEGKINKADHLRDFGVQIFEDKEALETFLKFNSEEAIKKLAHPKEYEVLSKMKLMTLVEGLSNKITLTTSREIESFAKNYNTWTDKITSARDSLDHLEEDLKLYHDKEKN